jgi:hypothetical protein
MSAPIEGIVTSLIKFGLLRERLARKNRWFGALAIRVAKDPLIEVTQEFDKDAKKCRSFSSL